ncbi:cytochrome P450 monooxygenase [Gordonia polyisoprenivorans VH2]|uniref:Cytochrome P450 monooxygenase n=2 Tax=Gordonia polyisoprenivorans TaxID=84595 RepID=H6N2U3_GORPV|nr:cytochrome P450 [Gordonia polyisoprenivorans]AFA74720.1 cytochrome P450 monooxygenase [Gordonia polyisoprenivorans VH2]NKY02153.1 cytochrome P450 [Gordonia polyisoprenivorans]OZC31708.1 cytochrome P450 [Gordonia polyisoprenivorans]QUD83926.1 cytochrome P450 [Gordonia polyisoprenivorans]GAB21255.1 putative cytochrome P450 [Gordonia polyisoprenivorans NBRC 16320 = JCM 10675]
MTDAVAVAGMQEHIPFDPYAYGFHEDPYPTYARLRREAPVYYNSELDFWALARHADVRSAFRDSVNLSNAWGVSMDPASYGPDAHKSMSFLALDDPKHMRIRKLVSKGFTPRRVNDLSGRITALTHEHWSRCLDKGEFDYVADFAGLLPMDVVSELLGVPESDRAFLRKQSDLLLHREEGVLDVPEAAVYAYIELHKYYSALIAERRTNLGDDLVSALLTAEIDDESGDKTALSDDEIVGFMVLMVVAGNETTTKLLANALYWAWRNPDEMARVIADPDLVPDWTEETLRYDNSTQMVLRRVAADVDYGEHTIAAGQRVLLLVGSANRDEDVFDDPDRYRIGRDCGQALMSFGMGTHFCLGAHLARLEANIGLTEVARSIRSVDIDIENAVRVHSVNVRGFAELPVRVTVR